MLFPLNQNTPQCSIFEMLNSELLHFLQKSITAATFSDALFTRWIRDNGETATNVCWSNQPTRDKFQSVWDELPDGEPSRQSLYDRVFAAQNIADYFSNTRLLLPELEDDALFNAVKSLTSHIFTKTKDLADAKACCNSSIQDHYQAYKSANNNSQLCYLCGTAQLSQDRSGIDDKDQWRSDYDHILCQDKYPIYSVHPGNFIPTCHICNSKAKGARNLLVDNSGTRRVAFYPLPPAQESCYLFAAVTPLFRDMNDFVNGEWQDPVEGVTVAFPDAPWDIQQKISVWSEVYKIPERIEAEIKASFAEKISSELIEPQDFDEFSTRLNWKAEREPSDLKCTPWRYWWHRVFQWMSDQNQQDQESIWGIVEWKRRLVNNTDMTEEFGI